jgi:hypothetical protein
MSELTTCNYCTWKSRKKLAKERKEKARLIPSKDIPGWYAMEINGKEVGWLKAITDYCVC